MATTTEDAKPHPVILALECKGCGRCVSACPPKVLALSKNLNERGYHYAEYAGDGCVGCGNCFYSCPEPSAVEVHIPDRAKPA